MIRGGGAAGDELRDKLFLIIMGSWISFSVYNEFNNNLLVVKYTNQKRRKSYLQQGAIFLLWKLKRNGII